MKGETAIVIYEASEDVPVYYLGDGKTSIIVDHQEFFSFDGDGEPEQTVSFDGSIEDLINSLFGEFDFVT